LTNNKSNFAQLLPTVLQRFNNECQLFIAQASISI